MPAKQGIYKQSLMIMNKYGCQMHITAELKTYWITHFSYICSNEESSF